MDLPTRLNGYPVIKATDHGNGCATVMVQKPGAERVVATWWPSLGTSWSWGHYFMDGEGADFDFAETSLRNSNRLPA